MQTRKQRDDSATIIKLYGELGKTFGKEHRVFLDRSSQLASAMEVRAPGFRRYLNARNRPGYFVYFDDEKKSRTLEDFKKPLRPKTIKIIPAIAGGIVKAIIGVAVGAALGGGGFALASGATGLTLLLGQALLGIGLSMALGGVSTLLFGSTSALSTDPFDSELAQNKPGFGFSGPVNTITQGGVVPIVYGVMKVGSHVGSASLMSKDID